MKRCGRRRHRDEHGTVGRARACGSGHGRDRRLRAFLPVGVSGRRAAGVVAAALVVAGVAEGRTLARRGGRTDRTGTVPPVLPRGEEYPVTEVAGVTATPAGVVKPGSWRAFTVPGDDNHLITYLTANVVPLGSDQRCNELVSLFCLPESPYAQSIGALRDGEFLDAPLVWAALPAGTAFVQFVDGDGRPRWERAIDGMVVFASPNGSAVSLLTALDEHGRRLGYVGPPDPRPRACDPRCHRGPTSMRCGTTASPGRRLRRSSPLVCHRADRG